MSEVAAELREARALGDDGSVVQVPVPLVDKAVQACEELQQVRDWGAGGAGQALARREGGERRAAAGGGARAPLHKSLSRPCEHNAACITYIPAPATAPAAGLAPGALPGRWHSAAATAPTTRGSRLKPQLTAPPPVHPLLSHRRARRR